MDDFDIYELVCPHVFLAHGEKAWMFADPRLIKWLQWFRSTIDRPVMVNDYGLGYKGKLTQRGYRCNLCSLVKDKTVADQLYLSAHTRFQAVDFSVRGMLDEEVRLWLERHKSQMPVNIRVEKDTTGWVHVDVATDSFEKITYFNG